jgi:hypothetical protein
MQKSECRNNLPTDNPRFILHEKAPKYGTGTGIVFVLFYFAPERIQNKAFVFCLRTYEESEYQCSPVISVMHNYVGYSN